MTNEELEQRVTELEKMVMELTNCVAVNSINIDYITSIVVNEANKKVSPIHKNEVNNLTEILNKL